jgi:hypothetical protein
VGRTSQTAGINFKKGIGGCYTGMFIAGQVTKDRLDYSRLSATSQAATHVMIYPPHTPFSLFNRFKTLSDRVSKFVASEAVTKKGAGWDDDDFYVGW